MRIQYTKPVASDKRCGWGKIVSEIIENESYGYAFHGKFLNEGEHDLPEGTVVIEQRPGGSIRNSYKIWCLGQVTQDGLLWVQSKQWTDRPDMGHAIYAAEWDNKSFLSFRDAVRTLLELSYTEKPVLSTAQYKQLHDAAACLETTEHHLCHQLQKQITQFLEQTTIVESTP